MRSLLCGAMLALFLTGCGGGGGSGSGSLSGGTSAITSNVVAMTVNAGPVAAMGGSFNIPYVTVTICAPSTSTCATIADVLVDTGSTGLRVMASALSAAGLTLPSQTDPNDSSNTVAECLPFVDGYTWGPMATASVKIGGETANNLSINIIDDNGTYNPSVPTGCTQLTSGTSLNSVQAFAANGILGVGLFAQDCGTACSECSMSGGCTSSNDIYYSCSAVANSCTPIQVALPLQAQNPVVLFATDNNGVIMQLPSVAASGATSATGSLIFGIGTQSNNALGSAVVLKTDDNGFFTTIFNGQTLSSSFIDSGSNAYFFNDSSLATCSDSTDFYCPAATVSLSATNQGIQGSTSNVTFQIANLDSISNQIYAANNIGGVAASDTGTDALNNDFDYGLSFFYGRSIYTAIEGAAAAGTTGPYFAY